MARRVQLRDPKTNAIVLDVKNNPVSIPTEFILHYSERDEEGIAGAIAQTVQNAAQQFGVDLSNVDVGAAKPFGILPLSPDIFDMGQVWQFPSLQQNTALNAGTFNNLIAKVRTPRDTRVLIYGFAARSPSPQFAAIQFTIDGDTQPLIQIERVKNFAPNSSTGREAYFPRDLMLEIGGNREVTLAAYSSGVDTEIFQLLGIMVITRSAAVSQDIGSLTS